MAEIAAGQHRESAAFAGAAVPACSPRASAPHPHPGGADAPPLPPELARTCTRCGQSAGPFGVALCVDCGGELLADVEFEQPDD